MGEHEELKERILRTAGAQFFEQGFSRITTEELSRQLGISKKTLYRVFVSKEAIVRSVVRRKLSEVDEELNRIFDDDTRSFLERFGSQMEIAGSILKMLSKPFLRDLSRHMPELWEEIQEFRRHRVLDRMEGLIRGGQQEGVIDAQLDPQLLVTIIITVADTLLVPDTLTARELNPRSIIAHMRTLLERGILTEYGRSRLEDSEFYHRQGENINEQQHRS